MLTMRNTMCHHVTVEGFAVPDYRGDRDVAGVLRRVKESFFDFFDKNVTKKGYVTLPF